jgi:hypothetical protein
LRRYLTSANLKNYQNIKFYFGYQPAKAAFVLIPQIPSFTSACCIYAICPERFQNQAVRELQNKYPFLAMDV